MLGYADLVCQCLSPKGTKSEFKCLLYAYKPMGFRNLQEKLEKVFCTFPMEFKGWRVNLSKSAKKEDEC